MAEMRINVKSSNAEEMSALGVSFLQSGTIEPLAGITRQQGADHSDRSYRELAGLTSFNKALQTFSVRRESLIKSGEELRRFLDYAGMQERGREVSGHLLRLELDSVKIAVIGEFKAGKSTLR